MAPRICTQRWPDIAPVIWSLWKLLGQGHDSYIGMQRVLRQMQTLRMYSIVKGNSCLDCITEQLLSKSSNWWPVFHRLRGLHDSTQLYLFWFFHLANGHTYFGRETTWVHHYGHNQSKITGSEVLLSSNSSMKCQSHQCPTKTAPGMIGLSRSIFWTEVSIPKGFLKHINSQWGWNLLKCPCRGWCCRFWHWFWKVAAP